MINNVKNNIIFNFFLLLSFVFAPLVTPKTTYAAGAAQIDCPQVTAIGAELNAAIEGFVGGATALMTASKVNVPVQNVAIETAAIQTGGQTTGAIAWQSSIKGLLDCIAFKAGQIMVDQLTEQTINWIKNGMNGSPYYAIDPRQFEEDLTEAVAGNFSRQIRSLELCDFDDFFINDLANWAIIDSTGDDDVKLETTLKCPFGPIKASEFYSGVQAFTWQWFETALNDSGNPFGVAVIAQNELTKQQAAQAAQAKQQLDWGQGFLSVVDTEDCPSMPASVKEWMASDIARENPAAVSAMQRAYCKKVTPAQLVESRLTKATDVEWDRLGLADNLSKIVNTLITKLSNDAIQGIFKK